MTIHHTSTRNITEYHFDLDANTPSPKCPDTLDKVVITFENGKFSRCDFPFRGTYTREQWSMLAEIENEIHRIELGLLK
jgi:hypothetical protein